MKVLFLNNWAVPVNVFERHIEILPNGVPDLQFLVRLRYYFDQAAVWQHFNALRGWAYGKSRQAVEEIPVAPGIVLKPEHQFTSRVASVLKGNL
ncbi:hypothetical protein [Rufibacter ruber]|uniref:hypothetical protein n=1 Tax=Rufibacter ruber TaxID=1783499 RepID=UPI00137A0F3A|nr:hypothetical protein [Rufibacter ruber]